MCIDDYCTMTTDSYAGKKYYEYNLKINTLNKQHIKNTVHCEHKFELTKVKDYDT